MPSPLSAMKMLELAKLTRPGTNFYENPNRFADIASLYTGNRPYDPKNEGVLGETHLDDPRMIDLKYTDFNTNRGADRTASHEGTHSKLLLNEKRKGLKPPNLPKEMRGNIYDMLANNPDFLAEYLAKPYEFSQIDPDYIRDQLDSDEVLARLNAIEGLMPAGQTIEKSKFGKQIFGEDNEYLDAYLTALIPEGYIREDKPFTPSPDERSLREKLRGWLNRTK